MFKKILVPVDGSDMSLLALDYTCMMAEKFDAEVLVLSVYKHHSFMESSLSMIRGANAPENLDDVLSAYAKEIANSGKLFVQNRGIKTVKGYIRKGQVAKQILDFAKHNAVDLIVIGSHGQGELSGYLLGGVSHKVTGLSSCPVLVV
jgi:nucleotide-binding universal stress UspA family protein